MDGELAESKHHHKKGRKEERRKKKKSRELDEAPRVSGELAAKQGKEEDGRERLEASDPGALERKERKRKEEKSKAKKHRADAGEEGPIEKISVTEIDKSGDGVKQTQVLGETAEKVGSEQAGSNESEGDGKKAKRKKKKKEEGSGGEKDASHSANEKLAEALGETVETVELEQAEADKSEGDVKKVKKKKEKDTNSEKNASDSADEKQAEVSGETAANKDKKKKKKKKKRKREGDSGTLEESEKNASHSVNEQSEVSGDTAKKRENKNKRRRKEEDNVGLEDGDNNMSNQNKEASSGGEKAGRDDNNDKKKKKKNKEKEKSKGKEEKAARSKKKGRRVSFSDEVEVFPIGDNKEEGEGSSKSDLVHGKWFTPEEDNAIIEAVNKYIQTKQLGEKGIEMVLNCMKHPEVRGCWADIGKSLPHRPHTAIYCRAHIVLQRSEKRGWTAEEKETIRRFHEQYGADWKTLASILGKNRIHVKDAWRRIKSQNLRKGTWSQDEYQRLFDLVNLDLQLKAHQEETPNNRLLRGNISWGAIGEKFSTRPQHFLCMKWYNQLRSKQLVDDNKWADIDDYRLLEALQEVDAVCVEDVDWDSLLDDRSGEDCRERWNQMVRHIGGHRERPFIGQVEVLSNRYCPEMLEHME